MAVSLRPMTIEDLEFVCEMRHDNETLKFLHDKRIFTLDQSREWFESYKPRWFIVLNNKNIKVGYMRISDDDTVNWTIKIGCDIHPKYRRNNYATLAYNELFKILIDEGYNTVWLEVINDNYVAISLYEKLGFNYVYDTDRFKTSGVDNSIVMTRELCPKTGKTVKVIVVYFGNRRAFPQNAKQTYDLLKYVIKQEMTLDQGCEYDTLFVYNMITIDKLDDESEEWIKKCEELLFSVVNTKSKHGVFKLLVRDNIGLSFAAHNDAFLKYREEYDYWLFFEDDNVIIKDNCISYAIKQFNRNKNIGCVGFVGVSEFAIYPEHVGGGICLTSREVLRDVLRNNKTEEFKNGCLPHFIQVYGPYDRQEFLGEIQFTNIMYRLGYLLVSHDWVDILVAWNNLARRNSRVLSWDANVHTA